MYAEPLGGQVVDHDINPLIHITVVCYVCKGRHGSSHDFWRAIPTQRYVFPTANNSERYPSGIKMLRFHIAQEHVNGVKPTDHAAKMTHFIRHVFDFAPMLYFLRGQRPLYSLCGQSLQPLLPLHHNASASNQRHTPVRRRELKLATLDGIVLWLVAL